jgi:hypothetical protein
VLPLNPTLRIKVRPAGQPITRPETKFGGDPVWIDGPQWPLSRRLGTPMQFIAQVALDPRVFPNAVARMAYIFMTDDLDGIGQWDPDLGENAVILQPGLTTPLAHAPLYTGPTVLTSHRDPVTGDPVRERLEYAADLTLRSESAFVPLDVRGKQSRHDQDRYWQEMGGHKIGGSPYFGQDDVLPFADWRLLLQIDGGRGMPFDVNFGDGGSAFAIANADVTQAKFLWEG